MPDEVHSISEAQLSQEARSLRAIAAAQKTLVGKQDRLALVLAAAVPVVLVVLKSVWEPISPFAVFYAFGILLAFVLGLDRVRSARLRAAARSRERHDCDVLDLPWNSQVAGPEPSPAEVDGWREAEAAAKGGRTGAGDPFPREVDDLPLPYARLACQSLALYWEPEAVRRYVQTLTLAAAAIVIVLLVLSVGLRPGADSVATTLLALTPLIYWVWREQQRWHGAGELAGRVLQRLDSAWRNAMAATIQAASLPPLARGIQNDIYAFRLQQPVIPGWAARRYWQRLSYDARRIDKFVDEYDQHREKA